MFRGVNINKVDEAYQKNTVGDDNIVGLIYSVPVTDTELIHYQPKEFITLKGVENVGITPALDANAKTLVYNACKEFFRLAPDATLWIIPVPENKTVKELVETNFFIRKKKLSNKWDNSIIRYQR